MQRYLIKEAKVHEGKEPLTCNPPLQYATVASIRYETDGKSGWLHCEEALGYHEFYHSEEDIHDRLVESADADEDFLASKHIEEFDNVDLFMAAADEVDMDEALENADSFEDWAQQHAEFMSADPAYHLVRYALALSEVHDPKDLEQALAEGVGKYADEIDYSGFLKQFERIPEP